MYTLNLERSAVSILEQVGVLDTSRWSRVCVACLLHVCWEGGGGGVVGSVLTVLDRVLCGVNVSCDSLAELMLIQTCDVYLPISTAATRPQGAPPPAVAPGALNTPRRGEEGQLCMSRMAAIVQTTD